MSEYKKAGVDIDGALDSVEKVKRIAASTYGPGVLSGVGGFSGLFHPGVFSFEDMVLAAGADGVGTKVKISQAMGKHDTVGIDLVAMNVDDVVTSGARPLFFLDYIAVGKLDKGVIEDLVSGVAEGCKMAGCALLGGETAQMSDIYAEGEYDLAGFCVGAVEKTGIIDGSRINAGDILVGLASSGLHSNGYSLARKVLLADAGFGLDQYMPDLGRTLGEELLEPTRIYAKSMVELIDLVDVKGIAHVTGGGLLGNLSRILPRGLKAVLSLDWPVPPVFEIIRKAGRISRQEMLRVFNMGIGMAFVLDPDLVGRAIEVLMNMGIDPYIAGEVVRDD